MKLIIENEFIKRESFLSDNSDKKLFIKGLRDSHCHLMWLGMQELGLDLSNCKSFEEVISECHLFEKNNSSSWLYGRGWNNELWGNKSQPNKNELDKHFPNKPVFLKRIDGHAAIVNSKSLELAGINSISKDPEGGKIEKDIDGNLTGILIDNAIEIIEAILPKPSDDQNIKNILTAIDKCLEYGLLEVHDMDVHLDWLPYFNYLAEENKLKLKIKSYIRGFDGEYLKNGIKPYCLNNLDVIGLKFFADGALGSRGAALLEDYSDDIYNKGIFLINREDMLEYASKGIEIGFEIATHAIGDAANRFVLDVYSELYKNKNAKFRIEHCQMIHPQDLHKIKELNVHCAIQPIHCISDEKMAEKRIGERVKYAYPWKTLLDLGVEVSGGSDFPIESPDPILGINAFIQNDIEWQQNEIINLEKALKVYGAIK